LIATLVLAVITAPAAHAGSGDVIRDCAKDGTLNGDYSQGELQGALDGLPSDLDEYTDCRSVIRRAALSKAGGNRSNPKATASGVPDSPLTTKEFRRLEQAARSGAPVEVGGRLVKPGDPGFVAAAFEDDLPPSLIAIFVLFGLAALTGIVFAAERRFPGPVHATAGAVARPFRAIGRGVRRGFSSLRR
jgi:hypothetical protein